MRYRELLRVYRKPEGTVDAQQDEDGLPVALAPAPELVVEGQADVQESRRRRTGGADIPFRLQRDADVFLRDESQLLEVEVGMTAVVLWGPEHTRESTATVVGVRKLDGSLLLDWTSRGVEP